MADMIFFGILFLALSLANGNEEISCPNLDEIPACSCKPWTLGILIKCSNCDSIEMLKETFDTLRDEECSSNVTVLLTNVNIEEELPENLFDDLNVIEVKIERSKLKFNQPAFARLCSSLSKFYVTEHVMISNNGTFSIPKLSKLAMLSMERNQIRQVGDSWLNGKTPNVNTVNLDFNDISVVHDHAFSNLSMLEYVSLSDNRIQIIKRSMFPSPANHLIRIDLSFNIIENLPSNIFTEMPVLKEIVVSGNKLKTLDENTWSIVWPQLKQLIALENRLHCDEKMSWIKSTKHTPYDTKANCESPKEMMGRSIIDVYPRT